MSEFEGQNKNRPEHVNNKKKAKAGGGTATHDVARLAVGLLLHGEEGLAAQLGAAGHADEAVDVEDLVHGRAAGALAHHVLPTAGAATCRQGGGRRGVRRGTPERQNLISRATLLPTDSQQLLERSLVRRPEPCQDSGAKGHILSRGDPMPFVFWSEWL